jgi:amino acid adenylation domain-containing protein
MTPPAEPGVQRPGPCIHELFEQQVERHPDAVAVVHDGASLTYRELDDRANRLAHHLRSLGVGPDVLVGLCLERGLDMIAGLLGILKAGGAYVPLDPSYPRERLAVMLHDSAAPVLVTQRSLLAHLPPTAAQLVCLDDPLPVREIAAVDAHPSPVAGPGNLAYVIFTSGSTGQPKGVLVTHRNVVRLMQATQPWFHFDERDVWTMFHSVAFDFSVWEIYGALLHGGRLVIVPYLVSRSPEAFHELLLAEHVTVLNQTPTAFQQLIRVDASDGASRRLALRLVIFGGEKLQMSSLAEWFARHGDVHPQLVNMYGITETTVHVTYRPLTTADVRAPSMIGVPIPDLQVHLLDEDLRPVADSVPGELFVGGAGVARGYLNRPELTAERFIPDPFRDEPHARLYRTGDRGRRLRGGDIEYLGRADDQLKIRGFRIEPGEIEAALLQVEGIRQAAVVARDVHAGDTRLVACLVGQSDMATASVIRAALRETLPDHMLPTRYVWMESLPLTAHGKLDRQSLPAWPTEAEPPSAAEASVAPRTPLEEQLAAIWCDLLGLDGIGVHDNFFERGGDSLTAMQVVATVRQSLGVAVPVGFFFASPTLAELAEVITTAAEGAPAEVSKLAAAAVAPRSPSLLLAEAAVAVETPAMAAQQSMWLLQAMAHDPATYNQPIAFRATTGFDAERLRRSLARLMARHAMLRTGLVLKDERLVQRVMPARSVAVSWREMRPDWPEVDQDRLLRELLVDDARRPFDLSQPPVWRVLLVHVGAAGAVLQFTFHHCIVDDWSLRRMMSDLENLYATDDDPASTCTEPEPALEPNVLSGVVAERLRSFWRETLHDPPDGPRWLTDAPRSAVATGRGSWHRFTIEAEPARLLRGLASQENATLFTVMLAACQAWLHRISGEDDVIVGTPVADRSRPESQQAVGYFLNTLPIRLHWDDSPPLEDGFRGVARKVRDVFLDALKHGDLPFEEIVRVAARGRPIDGQPLCRVLFVFLGSPLGGWHLGEAAMQPIPVDTGTSKFDLTLFVESSPEGFACSMEYATDIFDESTITAYADQFVTLVRAVAADPLTPIDSISLLTPAERLLLTNERNRSAEPSAPLACVHEQFDAQANRTPDAVALAWDGGAWTFGELQSRADRLAGRLRELGVGPDVPVGLFLERSPELFVGLLGILKAGGCYVPMDPALPASRLAFLFSDSACPVVITNKTSQPRALAALREGRGVTVSPGEAGGPVLLLLDDDAPVPQLAGGVPLRGASTVDQLAYVLYTSGSTGRPKGVAMPHGPLVNLLSWQAATSCMGPGDRTLQFASPGFDVSFQEIFSTWLSGGTLVLVAEQMRRDPSALLAAIDRDGIERLFLPVVMLDHLAEAAEAFQLFPKSLREVIVAGEQLRITPAIRRFFTRLPACRLWNHYGPTETHVATGYLLPADPSAWPDLPPIGRPIANTRVCLLDRHMQPVPRGVAGDLWIGGAAVARGYWRRPELTAERFVADPFDADPFDDDPHARLYRTGDRGRWRMDGQLEFLGRTDHQVKIRGHRVELGEIEAVLAGHSEVRAAAAVVRGDAGAARSIVAFVVGHEDTLLRPVEVRSWLQARLPDPCVPSRVVMLPSLPLNANGKVDRTTLERLAAADGQGDEPAAGLGEAVVFDRPDGERETLLASLWQSLLAVDKVGRHDNFFALGGTSLLAMRLVARARDALNAETAVRDVFEQPTLAGLADRWTPRGPLGQTPGGVAIPARRSGSGDVTAAGPRVVAASAAQRRLWFLQQYAPDSPVYTIATAHVVRGPLDVAALEASLNRIVARHDSLRTTFTFVDGEVVATVADAATWPLASIDATGTTPEERRADTMARLVAEYRRPFDLARGPLVRGCVIRLSANEYVIALVMHHALFDGWSMGVFHGELAACYEALRVGRDPSLDVLPIQYPDCAIWQNEWSRCGAAVEQEDYWRRQLADAPAYLDLPTDKARPPVESFRGAMACKTLEPAVADSLVRVAQQELCTPFMVVLTTFAAVLGRWSGAEDIVVGTPMADRARQETAGLIGCLVNTLAIRADLSDRPSFRELLARVRTTVLGAFAHAELPFERVVELLETRRDAARSPVFQVMFAWQDETGTQLRLSGLGVEPLPFDARVSRFDMTLFAVQTSQGIELRLEYATDLFEAATAARMLDGVATLLATAVGDLDAPIERMPIASPLVQAAALALGAVAAGPAVPDTTLVERFAAQASLTPAAIAVSCDSRRVTYGELDTESNRLASHLLASGAVPGDFVGILLDRSVDFVVAVLGILKAGCAYAPLPTEYPDERLAFMIADMRMRLLVTERTHADRLPGASVSRVFVAGGEPWRKASPAADAASTMTASVTAESPAYVMYTSGSTGKPKGVVVPHRAVVRLVTGQSYAPFGPKMRTLLLAPTAFDASTFELWAPLLHGGTCAVFPDRHPDLDRLGQVIRDEHVSCLWLTAGLFNHVIDSSPEILTTVDHVLTGGDALSVPHVRKAISLLPQTRLVNGYGPTESTTFACTHLIERDEAFPHGAVPIGRPLANTSCVIVDESLQPVPIGVPGELLVGGAGVALGYLNQPELTAEKFIPDAFFATPGARLYRTGDRCRWLPDGTIEFLGREDGQVKIRGHRVETGEIESALAALAGIEQAVVVVCDREQTGVVSEKVLRACVVPRPGATLDVADVRRDLARRLPEPMVPAEWLVLDSLPLTAHGKIDRGRLASAPLAVPVRPDVNETGVPRSDATPHTLLELEIARIWQRLFGLEQVHRTDDFFELGGHSLLAAKLSVELERLIGHPVPIAMLFRASTVESLAELLAGERWAPAWQSLVPLQPEGSRRPLFMIHGLGGHVFWYRSLARQLAPDQPVYGVQATARGDDQDGSGADNDTVEAMAADYVREIRALQPEGPYRIGGGSLGGWMAYAVAAALRSQGQSVMLLIFDTYPNCRVPLPAVGAKLLTSALVQISHLGLHGRRMSALPVHQWLRYIAWRIGRRVAPSMAPAWRGGLEAVKDDPLPATVSGDRYFRAVARYSARTIDARLELFLERAPLVPSLMAWSQIWFWRRLVQGPMTVHRQSREHLEMLSSDGVLELAAIVNDILAD